MERVYFISDVHLGAHAGEIEKRKTRRLVSFLKSLRGRADYLYIVGDLYDFWFEYLKAIPKVNIRVLAAFVQLIETGTEVRYLIGNHDIWHETYLENEIGLKLYPSAKEVTHNSLRLFVAHGDGLTPREWKIRLTKRIMRNRFNRFLYRLVHPDLGLKLMKFYSARSKRKGLNKFIKDYRQFAYHKLANSFDVVIMGHTHAPIFEERKGKFYVNLGDWVKNFTYLELISSKPELKNWQHED